MGSGCSAVPHQAPLGHPACHFPGAAAFASYVCLKEPAHDCSACHRTPGTGQAALATRSSCNGCGVHSSGGCEWPRDHPELQTHEQGWAAGVDILDRHCLREGLSSNCSWMLLQTDKGAFPPSLAGLGMESQPCAGTWHPWRGLVCCDSGNLFFLWDSALWLVHQVPGWLARKPELDFGAVV